MIIISLSPPRLQRLFIIATIFPVDAWRPGIFPVKIQTCSKSPRYLSSSLRSSLSSSPSLKYSAEDTIINLKQCVSFDETLKGALISSVTLLENLKAPEPTHSACHLLAHSLPDVFSWDDNGHSILLGMLSSNGNRNKKLEERKLNHSELVSFSSNLSRRIALEPIQYILGQWDFYNLQGIREMLSLFYVYAVTS